jgi:16S rRNA A1518/A1519 N6-dimethyltransferase RsmA/KsgA/DIM1 with predicted DNA glycosylase/AP lyase activity
MFARVVKESFSTRRKMLRRSLGDAFGDEVAAFAFRSSGVDGTRRPEELAIGDFARLSDALGSAAVGSPLAALAAEK